MAAISQSADSARTADWAFRQLFKLESDCRSQVPATQVQAIGQFPKLLDQFPFPTLVGSAFLKLGDLFRGSPNFLRYHIAQVFEASQHHLPQISQKEELLKRILGVLYSNDSIARTLALRLVGNGSIVFAKYPEAQHSVLLRFQSTHPLEITAAVQTTECMLKYSPEFLLVVWETVTDKANDMRIPDTVRAQVIHSLQYAAFNLQLSTLLYDHCRTWMSHPDSTVVVQTATMTTWGAVIQPHNELKLNDAEFVSCYIQHELASTKKAALNLLSKWIPKNQITDMGTEDAADNIKDRLVRYIRLELHGTAGSIDLHGVRLALMTLARMETALDAPGVPECWELAEALARWCIQVFIGTVPQQQSVLDYMQTTMNKDTNSDDNAMDDATDSSSKPIENQVVERLVYMFGDYRQLVAGIMLLVNISTTLSHPQCKTTTTELIAESWKAMSRVRVCADAKKYVSRFLRTTWSWCRDMRTDNLILDALAEMLGSPNQCIVSSIIAIASTGALGDAMVAKCTESMEGFANDIASADRSDTEYKAAWTSIAAILAQSPHTEYVPKPKPSDMAAILAIEAVTKWAEYVTSKSTTTKEHSNLYCRTADAECCRQNPDEYLKLINRSLNLLRILDTQATSRLFQLYIIQIRLELVQILDSWQNFRPTIPVHPSSIVVTKSLISRTKVLADQTNLVLQTFVVIDPTTRTWLAQAQDTLGNILDSVSELGSAQGANPLQRPIDVSNAAQSCMGRQAPILQLGPSLFSIPPNPSISIETRPDMEGAESMFTVFTGTQFNIIVEGFLHLPSNRLPIKPRQIRIAAWLSQKPHVSSDRDLLLRTKQNVVAKEAKRPTPNGRSRDEEVEESTQFAWDSALAFEAELDGSYFECHCAIPTPSLREIFGQYDTNIVAHVHISCALVDRSGVAWWIGPHKSHPLMISTTAKS
ncbi:Integrator complex subunit 7 [Coemansia sp. Benny D115]|nr:Integrator complex subunit 7 [Coemansia sp. Benny D115]